MTTSNIVGLLIAALGGAAVGLERQWSGHAEGPGARFAGIRTFTMLGAVGGFSGWLWTAGVTAPAAILLAGAVAVVAAAYVAGSRHDIDGTTEVAALVVLAAGLLAGMGSIRLASGIIALVTLLLVEKSRLHALVQRIDDVGLRSGVRFAVMALVVLPLLPEGPYGPLGGIRPREIWALVLFFSGLSFAGYVARRVVGPGHGYLVTGLLGGLVSSTNVTFTFARTSRTDPATDRALAFGAVAANAMLYPRVLVATAILNAAVVPPLIPYLAAPALVAALVAAVGARRSPAAGAPDVSLRNPLQLAAALQMAILFQAVLMAVYLVREAWGQSGVFTSAAVLGLTDVDALTVSMARGVAQTVSPAVAATAIAVGVLANTAMKLGTGGVLWRSEVPNDCGRRAGADARGDWRSASLLHLGLTVVRARRRRAQARTGRLSAGHAPAAEATTSCTCARRRRDHRTSVGTLPRCSRCRACRTLEPPPRTRCRFQRSDGTTLGVRGERCIPVRSGLTHLAQSRSLRRRVDPAPIRRCCNTSHPRPPRPWG